MELVVIEGITPNGSIRFEVVEKDDLKFTGHGFFKTREDADRYIQDFVTRYDEAKAISQDSEGAYEQQQMGSGWK